MNPRNAIKLLKEYYEDGFMKKYGVIETLQEAIDILDCLKRNIAGRSWKKYRVDYQYIINVPAVDVDYKKVREWGYKYNEV